MSDTDRILITDLLVRGIVGINDWERRNRQDILINIELAVDIDSALDELRRQDARIGTLGVGGGVRAGEKERRKHQGED